MLRYRKVSASHVNDSDHHQQRQLGRKQYHERSAGGDATHDGSHKNDVDEVPCDDDENAVDNKHNNDDDDANDNNDDDRGGDSDGDNFE